jgi:hypothetical protein
MQNEKCKVQNLETALERGEGAAMKNS